MASSETVCARWSDSIAMWKPRLIEAPVPDTRCFVTVYKAEVPAWYHGWADTVAALLADCCRRPNSRCCRACVRRIGVCSAASQIRIALPASWSSFNFSSTLLLVFITADHFWSNGSPWSCFRLQVSIPGKKHSAWRTRVMFKAFSTSGSDMFWSLLF